MVVFDHQSGWSEGLKTRGKITRLEGIIGGQWQEPDFFESALRRIGASAVMNGAGGVPLRRDSFPDAIARRIEHPAHV